MRKERYSNHCQSEPERLSSGRRTFLRLNHEHLSFLSVCVRWSRSGLIRFGLNCEFWPDHPQPTNTHSSKVNKSHFFVFITADLGLTFADVWDLQRQ